MYGRGALRSLPVAVGYLGYGELLLDSGGRLILALHLLIMLLLPLLHEIDFFFQFGDLFVGRLLRW